MKRLFVFYTVLTALIYAQPSVACTTMIVGKDASTDGSVLVSHSDDAFGDPRVIFVPAQDHEPGAMRPVFYSDPSLGADPAFCPDETVRLITKDRGPGYDQPGEPSVPIGYIPQVPHTYAYIDSNYGMMNEHQLSLGECTDKAKVDPEPDANKRLFYSAELGRVALERCKTAREAVELMGNLIMTYGYYGTGETLLVGDTEEAWVMEMCGYDKDASDGVWVAQRVPDDHFFVAANQFRIRDVEESENMLFSSNIFEVAESKGWWDPKAGPLDWTAVYGDGEYHHPYYSIRRVWRAMSLAAPSRNYPAWVEGPFTRAYPFSVKPDRNMSVRDVFAIHRDTYAGTEFDLSRGLAAGAFGDVVRYEGGAESAMGSEKGPGVQGAFERPLSIYRCAYCYVNQSRADLPDAIGGVTWVGFDRPATAVIMPLHVGALSAPKSWERGNALQFDRDSMWMVFNYVANYATLKYDYMIKDMDAERIRLESKAFAEVQRVEAEALSRWNSGDQQGARQHLTEFAQKNAEEVLNAWWALSENLYLKYNDGYLNDSQGIATPLFYPDWWLKKVGYEHGPTSYLKQPDEQ